MEAKAKQLGFEPKAWRIIKHIPGVNTLYGGIRGTKLLASGNKAEAFRTYSHALGGAATIGAGIGGLMITCAAAPFFVPAVCSVVIGGIAGQLLSGGGEIIADAATDDEFRNGTDDEIEKRFNDKMIKNIPIVGAVYSTVSSGVYLAKGNKKEAKQRAKNAAIGTVTSALAVGVSYGIGKLAHGLTKASGAAGDTVDDLAAHGINALNPTDDIASQGLGNISKETATGTRLVNLAVNKGFQLAADPVVKVVAAKACEKATQTALEAILGKEFPHTIVREEAFWDCFVNYHNLVEKGDSLSREKLLDYVIKCLTFDDYVDSKKDGINCLNYSLRTKDIVLLQAVMAFWPTMSRQDTRQATEILNTFADQIGLIIKYVWEMATKPDVNGQDFPSLPSALTYNPEDIPIYKVTSNVNGIRLLALDGGGIRGLVELEILAYIEKLSGNVPLKNRFNWMGGTSTGGIIALYLALGNSVSSCRKLYFKLKNEIFSGGKPYSASKFETLLKEFFPPEKQMKDIKLVKVAIMVSTGPVESLTLKIFTNYDDATKYTPIWEVARMTSAAPSFFDPFEKGNKLYYDGGLIANNPTLDLFNEAQAYENRFGRTMKNATVVSIGCGKFRNNGHRTINIDMSRFGQLRMCANGEMKRFFELFVNQACKTDGELITRMGGVANIAKCFYVRLTPSLPEVFDLDETDNAQLVNAIWHAKVFANKNHDILEEVFDRL